MKARGKKKSQYLNLRKQHFNLIMRIEFKKFINSSDFALQKFFYEYLQELKQKMLTAIADTILFDLQAVQFVARSTGNNLEPEKDWK